ncbi:FABP family protein [Cryobacterium sp. TMS1-13-1]|uniref:FABP family protein n=1 Tax=Cryobacterium sp. TMS1-13-1 TaxID=1259220 RepID=UPI001068D42A|nr:FABP family protein [Cryobacterium sp. TMS1-13-1]TFD18772.1 FABP family protein [Cryobacterium sp. TMS1-13-1]
MFDLPVGLPSELVPLSWLIGVWEGSGVLEYKIGEESVSRTFGHRISFSHDGLPHLNYSSYTWLEPLAAAASESDTAVPESEGASGSGAALEADAASALAEQNVPSETDVATPAPTLPPEMLSDEKLPLVTETGYWRLSRHQGDGDPGPGMLPGMGERPFTSAAAVETLRNRDGGFDIEVTLVHPGGVAELYLGLVKGPRIDLATDAVLRTAGSKPYAAATRLYGLVDNHLLWAWDIAALGQDLRTHASGRLARVS